MIFLSTLLISMFITISLIPFFRRLAMRVHALDMPNERKVHPHPMPKAGGIAMALGTLAPALLVANEGGIMGAVLAGAVLVVLFGLADDFKNLGYGTKFAGQILAALVVILYGGVKIKTLGMLLPEGMFVPDWLSIPLTLLVIVGVTNAINLSDGLDGLAGGISLLTFICIGYLAYQSGAMVIAVMSIAMVGAIFGFLRFNTYPATLFMGDAGSQLLGFMAVTLSLALTQENATLSPILPLILLGFPVLDTLVVMVERIADGRNPFVGDKNHFHHKLMRLGLFHTEAVFVIYMIQAMLVTSAFVFRFYSDWVLLVSYVIFSCIVVFGFQVADRTGWRLKRYDLVDKGIKRKLRVLKQKELLIQVSFGFVKIGVPLLLFLMCLVPQNIPVHVSVFCLFLVGLLLVTWYLKRTWFGTVMVVCLYLIIPFVVYLSEADTAQWMNDQLAMIYNLSFGILALFVVLTLKLTRRRKGFEVSPMHFLILFVALVVPNLPDARIQSYNMGLVAAKIIVLYFSYEILMGELRGRWGGLFVATITALVVMGARGVI